MSVFPPSDMMNVDKKDGAPDFEFIGRLWSLINDFRGFHLPDLAAEPEIQ